MLTQGDIVRHVQFGKVGKIMSRATVFDRDGFWDEDETQVWLIKWDDRSISTASDEQLEPFKSKVGHTCVVKETGQTGFIIALDELFFFYDVLIDDLGQVWSLPPHELEILESKVVQADDEEVVEHVPIDQSTRIAQLGEKLKYLSFGSVS